MYIKLYIEDVLKVVYGLFFENIHKMEINSNDLR